MMDASLIPVDVAKAALDSIFKQAGLARLQHYMPVTRDRLISTMQEVLAAQAERDASIADERAMICADAVEKIDAGELYKDTPHARASENCARMEALHIGRLIRRDPGAGGSR